MVRSCLKSLRVAVFSLFLLHFFTPVRAQEKVEVPSPQSKPDINPADLIFEHVGDAHEFHFATLGGKRLSIPLPVILYSPSGAGLSAFMYSAFEQGNGQTHGFVLADKEYLRSHGLAEQKDAQGNDLYTEGKIYAAGPGGLPDLSQKVYDISLTRNVVQLLLSLILLCWILISISKKYRTGQGTKTAPSGLQGAVEPVITFVRDEVARPNLGDRYEKYMPYLLSVFFFILINNLLGLIPGSANVTGNIAFTAMLGLISFVVILLSSNKHYWGHIFNPPVPGGIKVIMIPIEIMGIFTKPFALIIRLFANMISGHIVILSFIILIFIFGAMNTALGWGTSPLFVAFSVFIYLLELLVAFIQAFIFTNLTAVFIGQAFEGSHEHGDHHEEDAVLV